MTDILTAASRLIVQETGEQPYFKLPVPKPEMLQKIASLFGEFAGQSNLPNP